jgi:DNA-binding protein YbaB
MAAVNAATKKKEDTSKASMSELTQGLNIPGLM